MTGGLLAGAAALALPGRARAAAAGGAGDFAAPSWAV